MRTDDRGGHGSKIGGAVMRPSRRSAAGSRTRWAVAHFDQHVRDRLVAQLTDIANNAVAATSTSPTSFLQTCQ